MGHVLCALRRHPTALCHHHLGRRVLDQPGRSDLPRPRRPADGLLRHRHRQRRPGAVHFGRRVSAECAGRV